MSALVAGSPRQVIIGRQRVFTQPRPKAASRSPGRDAPVPDIGTSAESRWRCPQPLARGVLGSDGLWACSRYWTGLLAASKPVYCKKTVL